MHAIVFASVLAVASAGVVYNAAPIVGLTSSQYHAQDELGQYSYGYAGGPSSKTESKDAAGNVRGAYSYIDANGLTQTVQYVADPVNGFRVAATNLPVGPAPAPAVLAAAPIAAAPLAAAPLTYAAAPAFAAAHPVALGHPTYVAASPASPSNPISTVHVAGLPLPPADTPAVAAAKIQHAHAHADALFRASL